MHPLVKALPVAALTAAIGAYGAVRAREAEGTREGATLLAASSNAPSPAPRACPTGAMGLSPTSPCIPMPSAADATRPARERLGARESAPSELRHDEGATPVAKLPDRPDELARYQLPVATSPLDSMIVEPTHVRLALHAGASSAAELVELDGQRGAADVVAVGDLRGITVVTRHRVERDGRVRAFLVFYSRLARPGPSVKAGATLGPLAVVGFAGDLGALELDVRELRGPDAPLPTTLSALESAALGFPVDPRNVLPLRP